ncbi:MAG: cache domain-containing protein [Sedimenticola sp.]
MKKLTRILGSILLLSVFSNFALAQSVGDVITLVEETKKGIETNASKTISDINRGSVSKSLYVFVVDADKIIVAHGYLPTRVGLSDQAMVDVLGKPYTYEMHDKANKYGSGWVDYVYINPVTGKDENKLTYFERALGSDGKTYIVGSGLYYNK